MKKHIYTFNTDIEAIPVNYLPNILKNKENRNRHIFQEDGVNIFTTIVENLEPHYFKKLAIITVDKKCNDVILEKDLDDFLKLDMEKYMEQHDRIG